MAKECEGHPEKRRNSVNNDKGREDKMKTDKVMTVELADSLRDWRDFCDELEVFAKQRTSVEKLREAPGCQGTHRQ